MQQDTIYALSTSYGKSGIAIIRISGPQSLDVLVSLNFKTKPTERQAVLGKIYNKNLDLLDQVIVIYFAKNNSYTGEDIIELHTHGGIAIINAIFYELGSLKYLRLANNGEFSRIALENNKITLNQAESLIELINAETEYQRKIAIKNYNGDLEIHYVRWRNIIIELLATSEAYIDFPDDLLCNGQLEVLNKQIQELREQLQKSITLFKNTNTLMNGINICIAGPTNVGKSTLMNALSQTNTSIISSIKGTTRDVVTTKLEILGIPIILYDTAGLRETLDKIESIGIKKAKDTIQNSNILILILEAAQINDLSIISELSKYINNDTTTVVVINKIDEVTETKHLQYHVETELRKMSFKFQQVILSSLKYRKYQQNIVDSIKESIQDIMPIAGANLITNRRHQEKLQRCSNYLDNALITEILELKSQELRYASKELGVILGDISTEEILDKVFQSFCIGK